MLSWLANAWRVPELRKRLLFTFLILALYRLGSWIPAPGVDSDTINDYFNGRGGTILGLLSVFSGGALALCAVRARDHAVRHGLDHPAADDGRRAEAGAAAEGRRGGLRQDQPVHALPNRRSRGRAGDRLRVPVQARRQPAG